MLNVRFRPFDEICSLKGQSLGTSDWLLIDQERIDRFAAATDDFNDVHVDSAAARSGPFGTTIAHGMLTFGLVTKLASQVVPVPCEMTHGYYYGFDKVRLIQPVPCGSRVRGHFTLLDYFERKPGQWMRVVGAVIDVEGGGRPALTCETSAVHFIPAGSIREGSGKVNLQPPND